MIEIISYSILRALFHCFLDFRVVFDQSDITIAILLYVFFLLCKLSESSLHLQHFKKYHSTRHSLGSFSLKSNLSIRIFLIWFLRFPTFFFSLFFFCTNCYLDVESSGIWRKPLLSYLFWFRSLPFGFFSSRFLQLYLLTFCPIFKISSFSSPSFVFLMNAHF